MKPFRIIMASLLLSAAIPAFAQLTPVPPPVAPASAPADADPALWVVKDADTTIYLFGTVHILRPGMGWFDDEVKQAFDASDELRIEVLNPEAPEAQQAFAANMLALARDNQTTLSSRLSAEQRARYQAVLDKIGLPLPALENFEPWFVGLQLTLLQARMAGLNPASGVEATLTEAAKSAGKPISTLEELDQQIGFIDSTPPAEQVTSLMAAVDDIATNTDLLGQLIDSWAAGDPDATANLINEGMRDTPQMRRILLTERNRRWADVLKARMDQPGTLFVAVGAGHLAGADSVQQMLEQAGLTVTRVE